MQATGAGFICTRFQKATGRRQDRAMQWHHQKRHPLQTYDTHRQWLLLSTSALNYDPGFEGFSLISLPQQYRLIICAVRFINTMVATLPYIRLNTAHMDQYTTALRELYDRIPRRHSVENVKEINNILQEYESILGKIESLNSYYEKKAADFFPTLDTIRATVKMSTDNKASKKSKDDFFDKASGNLKDDIQSLIEMYGGGDKTL
jgi:hypothetical protein